MEFFVYKQTYFLLQTSISSDGKSLICPSGFTLRYRSTSSGSQSIHAGIPQWMPALTWPLDCQVSAKSSLTQGPPVPACSQLNSLLFGVQRSSFPHGAGKSRNLCGAIYILHFISAISPLHYISAILGCRGFGGLCQAPCSGQLHHLPDSM